MEDHPVRLALVDLSHRLGAPQRAFWELATRLPASRFAVRAWLSAAPEIDGFAAALHSRGLAVERLDDRDARWDWRSTLGLWLRLRRERPALVHVHDDGRPAALRVARAAAGDGVPVVLTRHGAASAAAVSGDARRAYARAEAVVVAARADTDGLVRDAGVDRRRVRWIPYGADVPDESLEQPIARAWREHFGARPFRPLWLCPLRLEPGRGHAVFLDALAELARRDVPFAAALPGDGPLRDTLRRQVETLGLGLRVTFLDGVDEPGPLLAAADAAVFPIEEGPAPITLLDALARARPVAASALPAVADLVHDGLHGRLVPPGDARALAAVLAEFHAHSEAAVRLGRAAAAHVRETLAWPRIVSQVETIYDEVLGLASFVAERETAASRA